METKKLFAEIYAEAEALDERMETTGAYLKLLRECVADGQPNRQLLNMISGYEAAFFYNALTVGGDVSDTVRIYDALYNLTERNEPELIYCLIRSKYYAAEAHFPEYFNELRDNRDLFIDFIYELLTDLKELIGKDFEISLMKEPI